MAYDLDHMPARQPPPGRKSEFENPESRAYQLVIVIGICLALVLVLISARIHVRLRVNHAFGVDDCTSTICRLFQ
jgi:hypothetical protein